MEEKNTTLEHKFQEFPNQLLFTQKANGNSMKKMKEKSLKKRPQKMENSFSHPLLKWEILISGATPKKTYC
jgi:hypothetical protein